MAEAPVPLWQLAKLIRSKNAGPFTITIDIMFDRREVYELVRDSGVVTRELVADLYGVEAHRVHFTQHETAMALKVSLPRRVSSGGVGDTDVFGGQFHGPLVELLVPPRVEEQAGGAAPGDR